MAELTRYEPGTFCWTDLWTTDVTAAKEFYVDVFGWTTHDLAVPDRFPPYVMAQVGGKDVAAMTQGDRYFAAKVPPHWAAYVAVTSADEMAAKAVRLGGKLFGKPVDLMDLGRMALVFDRSGARLCLWEAKKHIGAGRQHEHGALRWFELLTRDLHAARDFYTQLFGWTAQEMDFPGGKYTVFSDGAEQRAGMIALPAYEPPQVPSHWMLYFEVKDADAAAKKVAAAKGKVFLAPKDLPEVGRYAVFEDPHGAPFGVLQPANK